MNSRSTRTGIQFLVSTLPGNFFLLSPAGIIISVSNDYISLSGKPGSELTDQSIFSILSLNKENKSLLQASLKKVTDEKETEIITCSLVNHTLNNQAQDHFSKLEIRPVLNEENETEYVFLSIEQAIITQQKEDKFSRLLDSTPDAIILTNEKGAIEYMNNEAEVIFGYTREELTGELIERLIPGKNRHNHVKYRQDFVARDQKRYMHSGLALTGLRKDETSFPADIAIVPVKTDEGTHLMVTVRDITERTKEKEKLAALSQQLHAYNEQLEEKIKQRTEEIALREFQYRYLFENNPTPMWIFDSETFQFLDVNEIATRNYGYTREEFLSMTIMDIRSDIEKKRFLDIEYSSDYMANRTQKNVWSHIKKDGSTILVEAIGQPIQFNKRNARLVLINDVTEKLKAEEKLISSEKRFRALIENSYDIINLLDAEFKITYRSPSAERITGRTDEETIGTNSLAFIHPDDRQLITDGIKRLLQAPGNNEQSRFRYMAKDGSYIWMEGSATNLLHDENVKSIVFNYRDVTEKIETEEKIKASEERFRSTLDNMIEGVQIIGPDKKYIYVNDAFALQAWHRKEDLIGKHILEVIPEMKENRVYDLADKCFETKVPLQIENRFNLPGGRVAWYQLSMQPAHEGILILSVDITEKVKADAALKEERNKLEKIAETSPGMFHSLHMDAEGNFTIEYANNAIEQIYGMSFDLMKQKFNEFTEMLHEDDREKLLKAITESAQNLSRLELEYRYNHPAKGLVWHEVSDIPVKEADGSITWHGVVIDVTERREAEEQIAVQNARLQTLSNNLPGLMIFQLAGKTYEDRKFTYMSDEVVRTTGHTAEEVIENPLLLYSRIYEEDIPGLIEEEKKALENMSVFNVEVRFRNYRNELRWVNIVSSPRQQNDGMLVWDGFHIDITERKRSEENSRVSNQRYEAVAKATSDAIWDYDFTEKKAFILGSGYKHLFGYPIVNEFAEEGFWESKLHPDDKMRIIAEMDNAIANKQKEKGSAEYRFQKADGSYSYVNEMYFIMRDNAGNPVRLLGAKHDMTAKKLAEEELNKRFLENQLLTERLSAILNTLPADIALLDKKGIIQDMNEAWKKVHDKSNCLIYGYRTGDSYLHLSANLSGIDKKNTQTAIKGIRSVLAGREKEFVFEYSCNAGKAKKWFRMITTQLKGKYLIGAVVMHIDITEIKKLEEDRLKIKIEEQRKITEAMVQGQEKERNSIGIELHDNVNQILVSSNMLLSMIEANPSLAPTLLPKCIENIRFAVNENRRIAHELVIPDRVTETLLQQIKRVAKTMFNDTGTGTRVIHKDYDENLLSEEQKLTAYRVVQEQCTNILKHAKASTVIFRFSTGNNVFRLRISDNGVGMKKDKLKEGIGLRNIRNRLSVLNGSAAIESTTGKGFTLIMEMPLSH